jgi:hypothetical protein
MPYWDFRAVDAELLALLADSPIKRDSIIEEIKEYLSVGEPTLAFETLCTWLYEDRLPISRAYYERLASMAEEVYAQGYMARLDELISE